jgi:hypothetical protein
MPTKLVEKAIENSTFAIKTEFAVKTDPSDAVGTPFVPNSGLNWSLVDEDGNVINDRLNVELTPASEVIVLLQGDDLALRGGPAKRYVIVRGTYNGVLGNDLPIVDETSFQIQNLKGAKTVLTGPVGILIMPSLGTPSIGLV